MAGQVTVDLDTRPSLDLPVVAIGASAGALDALRRFFKLMPGQCGMAFVVIVHLDPEHVSHLPSLLVQHTPMAVTQALDGERLAVDHVYIIPPNKVLGFHADCLQLDAISIRPRIPMPIDHFLSLLAEGQREQSVVIILSGTGNDGTAGLKEIKEAGGLVLAQLPGTAEYDGMPRSAIATGLVDLVLPLESIAAAVLDYVGHADFNGGCPSYDNVETQTG